MKWILIVLLILIAINVIAFLILAAVLYSALLVRTKKEKWGRDISMPDDPEYVAMYNQGLEWGKCHEDLCSELEIKNGKFRLFAKYFDFGSDKAVIIIPGRMECCSYSFSFAEPYRKAGYNVLAIDVRAHGLSDGKICALGYKEYSDVIAWGKYLHEKHCIKEIVLHGICIGASTALFTMVSEKCPDYFRAMVADGMYVSFGESFKNHMIEKKRPLFPFYPLVMLYIRLISGVDAVHDGPIRRIPKLKKPILFIHSRKDIYSLPEKTEELYALCGSQFKNVVWFDEGGHSRVRFNNTDEYDNAIKYFLDSLPKKD